MTPQHVMLDIETLGTVPRSVILSIGAVLFDPLSTDRYTYATFYRNVDQQSCVTRGMLVDADTVEWWGSPDLVDAREALADDQGDIAVVLREFAQFFKASGGVYIWGHGSCFDVVLVEEAMRVCGVPVPWNFRHVRDTRTLFDVSGFDLSGCTDDIPRGVVHNALDDAEYQVGCVRAAYALLKT